MTKDKKTLKMSIAFLILFIGLGIFSLKNINHAYFNNFNTYLIVSSEYQNTRGALFDIDIFLKQANNLAAGFIELEFDSDIATVMDDIKYKDFLDGFLISSNVIEEEGKIRVAFVNSVGSFVDGKIFSIPFRLNVRNGVTDIKVTELELYDLDGRDIKSKKIDGLIGEFKGIDLGHIDDVSKTQKWHIRFNEILNKESINKKTVSIVNSNTRNIIDTNVSLIDESIIKIEPMEQYQRGTYYMIVDTRVRSQNGRFLKEPVRLSFSIS